MLTRSYHINLPIASPAEIESTARQLTAIREGFLSTGSLELWHPRPLIEQSWDRCRTLRVNPSKRLAPLAVARESQLQLLHEENTLLLRAAHPVMNHLVDVFAASGYVVVLSDAQGRLLDVFGDTIIRRRLARIDFVPGGNWSEHAAGTNAIGTALADGHVVQLMAAEHYCDGWQDLTCTAAPIRHPLTNEIIGVLDVTGDYHLIRPFLTTLLAGAVMDIRQQLHILLTSTHKVPRQNSSVVVSLPGVHAKTIPVSPFYSIESAGMRGDISNRNLLSESVLRYGERTISGYSNNYMHTFENDSMGTSARSNEQHNTMAGISTNPDIQLQLDLQERRAWDAERLAAATGAISASLDLYVTLEKVVEQVMHLLATERAGVYLFDEKDEIVFLHILSRQLPLRKETPDLLAGLLKRARAVSLIRERGEPVIIDDVTHSELLPETFYKQTDTRSIVLLPLVTARGVMGFLTASRPMAQSWRVDDIRLGLSLANQSATAIENARLFYTLQQHNRHIEALNAIAQTFSTTPNPSQHLDSVLKRITEIMHLDTGMILLLDDETDQLILAAHCGLVEGIQLDLDALPIKTLYAVAYSVIDVHEPLLICGNKYDGKEMCEALRQVGFYNVMAVPLAASGTILGVLLVGNCSQEGFAEEDFKFFSTIGRQLGLALKNVRLLQAAREMEVLREADQLKSSFLAAVSHDLRSPLTAIRASVESLLDSNGIQSVQIQGRLLENISGQANRLDQLVDQLLDLSRIEAGALALDCDWTELPVLIDDVVTKFKHLHMSCFVEQIFDLDLPPQYIDPDRLVQVIWNLLENAYKYAPKGSPIVIEAHLRDSETLITLADRGHGIPRDEQEKVFQRFYRLSRDQRAHVKGSGLGLAICRGIVEAHGGRIWVEERSGGGSIFFIALPLAIAEPLDIDGLEEQVLV